MFEQRKKDYTTLNKGEVCPRCEEETSAPNLDPTLSFSSKDRFENAAESSEVLSIGKKEWTLDAHKGWFQETLSHDARNALAAAGKYHIIEHFSFDRGGKHVLVTVVGESHLQKPASLKSAEALLPFYPVIGCERGRSNSVIGKITRILVFPVMMIYRNPFTGSMITAAERAHKKSPDSTSIFYLEEGHIPTLREDMARAFFSLVPLSFYTAGIGCLLKLLHESPAVSAAFIATGIGLLATYFCVGFVSSVASLMRIERQGNKILSILSAPTEGLVSNRDNFMAENIAKKAGESNCSKILVLMGEAHLKGVLRKLCEMEAFTYYRETFWSRPYSAPF